MLYYNITALVCSFLLSCFPRKINRKITSRNIVDKIERTITITINVLFIEQEPGKERFNIKFKIKII